MSKHIIMFQIFFAHAIFIKRSFLAVSSFEWNNAKPSLACLKSYRDRLSKSTRRGWNCWDAKQTCFVFITVKCSTEKLYLNRCSPPKPAICAGYFTCRKRNETTVWKCLCCAHTNTDRHKTTKAIL